MFTGSAALDDEILFFWREKISISKFKKIVVEGSGTCEQRAEQNLAVIANRSRRVGQGHGGNEVNSHKPSS